MAVKSQRIARTGVLGLQRALLRAVLGALVVMAVGPVGIAMATPPKVTIESPTNGSSTTSQLPLFSGSTDDTADQVTLNIYAGPSATGVPLQTPTTLLPPLGGKWELAPTSALTPGVYTALAEQTSLVEGTGKSESVTVTVEAAPVVTSNPASKVVKAGETATFEAAASGTPAPTVQWQVSTDGGSTFSNDTTDSGNTTGTLTVESTTVSENGQKYRAVFTNTAGTATTEAALLTVEPALVKPEVTKQPVPVTVNAGEPASFTAEAASNPALLTVEPALVKPEVTKQPVPVTVNAGEPASFTAEAGGNPAPTVQWEVSEKGGAFKEVPGATSDTYTILSTSTGESGNRYEAVFSNSQGKATSNPALLTVNPPPCTIHPAITEQPANQTVTAPASATFEAAGSTPVNCAAPSVQWYSKAPGAGSFSAIGGATSLSYTTPATTTAQSGTKFEAVFKNTSGETTTNEATLTVNPPPPTVTSIEPSSGPTAGGTSVKIKGKDFLKGATVKIGSSATSVVVVSETEVTAKTAAAAAGAQEVVVTDAGGTSTGGPKYTYVPPPTVTLKQPKSPSNNTTPSFTGNATDTTPITVKIYAGATAEGSVVSTATATGTGGSWSSGNASPALKDGQYTATATQEGSVGNPAGVSPPVTFTVDTEPPKVTLEQPTSPSNETAPTFSGTASAETQVVVHVYEGKKAEGTEVASASATPSAGTWSSGPATPALSSGRHTYTAVAEESSPIGNAPGKSSPVTFVVDTNPPTVSLNPLASPSKVTTPKFKGSASDTTTVTVHVYKGTKAEGSEVASVTALGTGGTWESAALNPALADGTYTAVATQPSSLGNGPGTSNPVTFEVNTQPPTVALNQPASPSKNTTPTFTGTASATTPVVVHVFAGSKAEGTEVASATATGTGGGWTAGALSPTLASGEHTYTAVATQESPLGNPEGRSSSVTFTVDTLPPTVTLNQPTSPSKNTTPSFSGTASANTEVVVRIFEGTKAEGTEVSQAKATGTPGKWVSGNATLSSGEHTYTAIAEQSSPLGNPAGTSAPVTFVVDTSPPAVTLNAVASPSKNTTPSFSGTDGGAASASRPIVVHVFEGTKPEGKEVGKVTTPGAEGAWSSGNVSLVSGEHTYTAIAIQESPLGNEPGKSNAVTFTVDTLPPTVTLVAPPTPSKNTTPSFSGEASENTEVVVHVFEGSTEKAQATTTASGGKWSTSTLSAALPLGKHTFTAHATEVSGLGNKAGESNTVTFEVNTEAPVVTLAQPPTPSNKTTPPFSGTASEETEVEVHVFEGSTEKANVKTTASGGKWSTTTLSKALPLGKHTFTALATEVSGLGNKAGESNTVTFEVNTEPPVVTLESPALISNNTTPAFSGTANETLPVTVEVFKGAEVKGKAVAKLVASVSGGHWSSAHLTSALENGPYTAIASEPSSLENPTGFSKPATFEVNTEAPAVMLNPVASPSNDREPSFSGSVSSSAAEPVTVFVYEGATPGGRIVGTVTGSISAGKWSSGRLAPLLPSGHHTFTAVASAPSKLKNATGKSAPVVFVVNTERPTVTLTQPKTPSNDATPSFSGTASETTSVVVKIYRGAAAEGSAVTTATATGTGGSWASGVLSKPLEDGQYTAIATQESAIGNGEGKSAPVSFTIDTKPPTVTLNGITSPSSDRVPSFSGTASESMPVTVEVFKGAKAEGPAVASKKAEVASGEWYAGALEAPLEWGEYTAVATEPSAIGNESGMSSAVTFVVEQIAPVVITEASSSITETSAALYASVNPVGGPVSGCNFEVGSTTSYGRTVGCGFVSGATAFPPASASFVPVFIRIYGLRPGTTYHYRAIAVGEGGTGSGPDKTFTTTLGPSSAREPQHAASPPPSSGPAGGVAGFFAAQLTPAGRAARIAALLRTGAFSEQFNAPEPGTAVVKWYYLPPGAKLARKGRASKGKPSPVLVASGRVTFHAAGTAALEIHLTGAGRRLLRHAKRIRLTATCVFTPVGGSSVTTSGSFELRR